jgi:hypothetical protein
VQEKTFTGTSLEEALKNNALSRSGSVLVGMVKPSEKGGHVSFTRSRCGDTWVDIPNGMIEEAKYVGQNSCKGHTHPVMEITLWEAKDPGDQILSALLAQSTPAPSQAGPLPMQADPISVPQTYPETQAQGAFGNYFPSVDPEGPGTSFIVPLPQTSALTGGLGGGTSGFKWGCWTGSCCAGGYYAASPTGWRWVCTVWRPCERCIIRF